MATFTYRTEVPFDRQQVFGWHERPGALVRLSAPGLAKVVHEPTDGLRDGSRSELKLLAPLSMGVAGTRLVAEHRGYRPPEQFEDTLVSGPVRAWHHTHRFRASDTGTVIDDEIEFDLPVVSGKAATPALAIARRLLQRMFDYRARALRDDLTFHAAHAMPPKRVLVAGSSGLVGTQLCALLGGGGHEVVRLVRRTPGDGEAAWDPETGEIDLEEVRRADIVIHLGGAPIAGRFTEKHKRAMLESRVNSTRLLAETLAAAAGDGKRRVFVCASATGYYGADRGDEVLTEDSSPGDDFLASLCQRWEAECEPARAAGVRVVNVRTGIVQSAAGGQLALQLPLFQIGLGGRLGDGRQWMPWVTVDDHAGLFAHAALTDGLEGPLNACAPDIVRNAEYSKTLAKVLRRPAVIPVPAFAPKALLGEEGGREFALAGQRMSAQKALDSGYAYRHPDLAGGLRHVLAL